MKERPILFSAEMVRAILDGRKTKTRRPKKGNAAPCAVGDVLWARETWRAEELPSGEDGVRFAADNAFVRIANTAAAADLWCDAHRNGKYGAKWRPSIHMPRWAARIFLKVTDVRIERIQAITEDDARAEGASSVDAFCALWDSTYGAGAWNRNEWVWALTFERVEAP